MKRITDIFPIFLGKCRTLRLRTKIAIAVVLVIVVLLVCCVRISASAGVCHPIREGFEAHDGKELVVLVHAYTLDSSSLTDVRDAVREVRGSADILMIDYPSQRFSNADPYNISSELCDVIQRRVQQGGYTHITLIGHSVGALLIRKAYVYAVGQVEDLVGSSSRNREPLAWSKLVDRIILLAGMNRGWSVDPPPPKMSFFTRVLIWVGRQVSACTGTGKLIFSCERGRPFVSDLRVQWMRARHQGPDQQRISRTTVIQFLGDEDDIVSDEDSRDIEVASDFIFVKLHGTGHQSIRDFQDPDFGRQRHDAFCRALSNDPEVLAQMRKENPVQIGAMEDNHYRSQVRHVVFVMHGIRDLGHWTGEIEPQLRQIFHSSNPSPDAQPPVVINASYGYFGMGPFLLFADRQRNVRWFMDQYTEVLAEYPSADPESGGRIDFIGHSNGTYLLGSALRQYRTLVVNRAVLGGSVLPRDYDWQSRFNQGQIKAVKDYVGSSDWVVACFPHLFEAFGDIGSAGFNGFDKIPPPGHEVTYVPGGHFAAFEDRNVQSIATFIMKGAEDVPENYGYRTRTQSGLVSFLSKIYPLVWVAIIVLLGTLAWGFAWLGQRVIGKPKPLWYIVYLLIVIFLLYNI